MQYLLYNVEFEIVGFQVGPWVAGSWMALGFRAAWNSKNRWLSSCRTSPSISGLNQAPTEWVALRAPV